VQGDQILAQGLSEGRRKPRHLCLLRAGGRKIAPPAIGVECRAEVKAFSEAEAAHRGFDF